MSENIITVTNVSFSYENTLVLKGLNFSVQKGDFTILIGSNGAGKSTLLKLLLGELIPSKGKICLFQKDTQHFHDWAEIGYVQQNGLSLHENFPASSEEIVEANLASQIGLFRFPKKEHHKQVQHALELVGMQEYKKQLIGNMSGGQQQRVLLARALVSNPKLMILDEPTTGVDTKSAHEFYSLLKKLNDETGLTIFMVTHDVRRASEFAKHILCLENGTMVQLEHAQIQNELTYRHVHPNSERILL